MSVWNCTFISPACELYGLYWVSINSCINKLSSYVNKQANIYALSCLLPTATWGVYQPFNDHLCELCNPVTNESITIWIISHITSTWFVHGSMPEKQVSITIIPLSDALASQSTQLIMGLTVPPSSIDFVFLSHVCHLTTYNTFRCLWFWC